MTLRTALLLACLFALPAFAAGPLESLRSQSRSLRDEVSALRSKQLEGRNELSTLSSRIQTLKAESKGKLLPGSELDAALKRSQELSGVLSDLAAQVNSRESGLESANLTLLDALSTELTRVRTEFDRQSNRDVRRQLIEQMRRLRGERDALRQTLPATKLPALDTVKPSDDPEELLEQADLLRDNQDKLTRELKLLDARIAERREEQELDRRVQRFMGEESAFDDGDRRLRVQRTTTTPSSAPTKNTANPTMNPTTGLTGGLSGDFQNAAPTDTTAAGTSGTAPPPVSGGGFGALSPSVATDRTGTQEFGAGAPSTGSGFDSSNIRVTNASDARPQVGGSRSLAGGHDDDLSDLEVERARLQGLASQLKKKADELARRAAELK